jgi:uncharacterized membrane protein
MPGSATDKEAMSPPHGGEDGREAVFLGLVLALGLLLRLFRLGDHSIWLDEAHTIWIARLPFQEMLRYVGTVEIHPYLYYVLLHFYIKIAGTGEFLLRLPSALMGSLEVYVIYLLGRQTAGRQAGILAGFLAAISSFEILFAQEIRMYSLLLLMIVLASHFFISALNTGKTWHWTAYVLCTAAGLYTDYRMAVITAAGGLFYLIFHRRYPDSLKAFMGSGLVILVAAISLLPLYLRQSGEAGGLKSMELFLEPLTPALFFRAIFSLFGGGLSPLEAHAGAAGGAVILLFLALSLWQRLKNEEWAACFVPVSFLAGLAAITAFSLKGARVFSVHNLIFLSPFFLLLLSIALRGRDGRVRPLSALFLAAFIIINMHCNYLWFFNPASSKQNFKAAVSYVQGQLHPGDRIALAPDYQKFPFDYYYRGDGPVYYVNPRILRDGRIQEALAAPGRVFWIFAGDRFIDPEMVMRRWLDQHFQVISAVEFPCSGFHSITGRSIQVFLGIPRRPAPPQAPPSPPGSSPPPVNGD